MTKNDDRLLERFFDSARRAEIPDAGFSRRVMGSLPDRALLTARLWWAFCVLLGVCLAVGFRVWRLLGDYFWSLVHLVSDGGQGRLSVLHLAVAVAVVLVLAVREVIDRERLWL